MAVSIHLARHGSKKRPFYRIVVADSRSPRDGRNIEQVGVYDPRQDPVRVEFRTDRLSEWLEKGARPSATVAQLMRKSGFRKAAEAPAEMAPGDAS